MFERALALDPNFALAHEHLGQIYAVQGDYAGARAHAREAAARGHSALLEMLARPPEHLGQFSAARGDYPRPRARARGAPARAHGALLEMLARHSRTAPPAE